MYLKLQPYKETIVRHVLNQKLGPKYFGPFVVNANIGQGAYRLKLPEGSRIHPTFHVSQLKKHIGKAHSQQHLPLVSTDGALPRVLV